jgi:hypothetical protein
VLTTKHAALQRRAFLRHIAVGGLAVSSFNTPGKAAGKILPVIKIGDKSVTRLIAGSNPIGGWSHSTVMMDQLMRGYFTTERTIEFILHCEEYGINTLQIGYSPKTRDALLGARDRGSKIQWICLTSGEDDTVWKEILALKPIAMSHHGEVTDQMFKSGNHPKIRDFLKKVHDRGLLAGMSTHHPDNLARAEDADWETDFYMACFYNKNFDRNEVRAKLGDVPVDELYLEGHPQVMTRRMQQIKKPCLGFKILAAGRLCKNRAMVEKAFAFAFSSIKPRDAVIVGMFPILSDQVQEDADFARKYGTST